MSSVANTGGPPASVKQSAVPAGQTLKQTKVGEGDDETNSNSIWYSIIRLLKLLLMKLLINSKD